MVDKTSDTAKVAILPGVELTPEAQKILNKQLNRKIVWSYNASKVVLQMVALLPALAALYFGWGFLSVGINSISGLGTAACLVGLPLLASFGLWRLASGY